jgi:replicative DNA helicase
MVDNKILADDYIEKALLATAISNRACFWKIIHLDENDFYFEDNRNIFIGLKEISKRHMEPCAVMLYQVLSEMGVDSSKTKITMTELLKLGSIYNFESQIEKVIDYSRKRKLKTVLQYAKEAIDIDGRTTDEVTAYIDSEIQDVNKNRFCNENTIDEILRDINIEGEKYCPTGIDELDDLLLGLFGGQLVVIGSRPGIGKSAIVLQIAKKISQSIPVLLFSLEMPKTQIIRRMITTETGVNANKMRAGALNNIDKEEIGKAMISIMKKYENLVVVDSENKFWNIANNIKRLYYSKNIGAVIIDYLQLCQIKSQEKRYQQLGEMTSTLKNLSVKLKIPIIILSQLSRTSENSIPQLSDLRESGNIEQDADVVIFLHRRDNKTGKTELIVAKNRDGSVGYRKLYFNFSRVQFESYMEE